MSLKAIVTDGRGAILRSGGRIVTYSPECWKQWKGGDEVVVHEFRSRDEDDLFNLYPWDETGDLYEKMVKTAFTIYVDSVPGATEESDTGNGTADHPFSCLNSALHFLEPPSFSETNRVTKALATGCFCGGTPVVKIILTGKVDYERTHRSSWERVYIEGRNGAEFEVGSDEDWRFGDTVANCRITVSGDERDYGFYAPAIFENCEIYSAFGLGRDEDEDYRNEFLLYNSEFHLTTNGDGEYGDSYLGFMYNSNIYIEPGPPPDPDPEVINHVFYLRGANSCRAFYKSDRKAKIYCNEVINSTIGGNAVWG